MKCDTEKVLLCHCRSRRISSLSPSWHAVIPWRWSHPSTSQPGNKRLREASNHVFLAFTSYDQNWLIWNPTPFRRAGPAQETLMPARRTFDLRQPYLSWTGFTQQRCSPSGLCVRLECPHSQTNPMYQGLSLTVRNFRIMK